AGPRQVLASVAEHHVDLVPRHVQHFGDDAVHVEDRMSAEVADARLDLEAAVRLDDEQAVEADRSTGVRADRDADAARFVPLLLAAGERGLALVPLELLASHVERFLDERARHIRLAAIRQRRTKRRLAGRGVDLADLDLIDAELSSGLRD